jgi:WD40 repeat protein
MAATVRGLTTIRGDAISTIGNGFLAFCVGRDLRCVSFGQGHHTALLADAADAAVAAFPEDAVLLHASGETLVIVNPQAAVVLTHAAGGGAATMELSQVLPLPLGCDGLTRENSAVAVDAFTAQVAVSLHSAVYVSPPRSDGEWVLLAVDKHAASDVSHMCFGAGGELYCVRRDNTLLVWDVAQCAVRRDHGILCNTAAVTCVAYDAANGALLVGLADGLLRVYSTDAAAAYKLLFTTKCGATLFAASSIVQQYQVEVGGDEVGSAAAEMPNAVLGVVVSPVDRTHAMVITEVGVASFHRHSYAAAAVYFFEDAVDCAVATDTASSWGAVVSHDTTDAVDFLVFDSASDGAVNIEAAPFTLAQHADADDDLERRSDGDDVADGELSLFHATGECRLPAAWLQPLQLKKPDAVTGKNPVTFGRGPIKSSGLTSAPWSAQQAAKAKSAAAAKARAKRALAPRMVPNYNCCCDAPTKELRKTNALLGARKLHGAVINNAVYDHAGGALLTSSGDMTAHLLRLPLTSVDADGTCLRGPTCPVTSVDVTAPPPGKAPVICTSQFDGTVSFWKPSKRPAPSVTHSCGKEAKCVKFFYADRLAVVAAGAALHVLRYTVDSSSDDLNRQKNGSAVKQCGVATTAAQCVTAMDVINYFESNAVVYAGSNKQLGVYDFAAEAHVVQYDNAHSRAVHSVAMASASRHAALPHDALHMFCSAGLDGCVRLWDARAPGAVRTLSSHTNVAVKTGLAMSPCMRYVVVGSEDRAAYVYDVGLGAVAAKIPMPDVVSAVAFHPTAPQMALCTQGGDVRLFSDV